MIRLLMILIFLILFCILSIPLFLVEWIIGKFNRNARDMSSLRIVQGAFKVILFLAGTRTKVIGFERIPKNEPVLFIGNHRGFFDTVVAYSMMEGKTGFIAKKEMAGVPFIRIWMRYLYCLFLERDSLKEGLKVILEAIDRVKNQKVSIVIFPEGARNAGEGVNPFKEGSFKIAEKSGCKIVPMVQCGNEKIFERQFPWIKKADTIIEFGDPIDVNELPKEKKKALGAYVHDIVLGIYNKNQAMLADGAGPESG